MSSPTSSKPEPTRTQLYAGIHLGDFTLIQRVAPDKKASPAIRKRWRVECICGKRETVPESYFVRKPNPKRHCDHLPSTSIKVKFNREYRIWCMMRQRCYFPNHVAYKHYGGRGIEICAEWLDPETGFEAFLRDIGPAPSDKHSIDRIDVNGHYEKFHRVTGKLQVKWATAKEQAQNTRAAVARREAKEAINGNNSGS